MDQSPLKSQKPDSMDEVKTNPKAENEWEAVLRKIRGWLDTTRLLSEKSQDLINPSLLLIVLIAFLALTQAYTNILSAVEKIPLAPSLCELIGTLWLTKLSITRLLRKKDRQEFLAEIRDRWRNFIGQ